MDTKEPRNDGAEVVDLAAFRALKANAAPAAPAEYLPGEFARITEQNKANEERLRKERLSANKNTLRSYRIKH